MACPQLILLGCLTRPHQIAQRLRSLVRNPHCRQIAGSITASQPLRIAAIRLHPVAGLHRHQRRRDHFASNAQLRQLPIQHVTRRARFVAALQLLDRPQPLHQLADRLRTVGNRSQAAHLAIRLGNRNGYRFGMDIPTHKSYLFLHDRFLSACGSEL
jgi:hypothetical protein